MALVPELLDHGVGQVLGGLQPAEVEGKLVKLDQAVDHVSVILKVGIQFGLGSIAG